MSLRVSKEVEIEMSTTKELTLPAAQSSEDAIEAAVDTTVSGQVCIANISTAERRKRLRFGIIAFAIGLAILVVLMAIDANRLWRLPLVLFFWAAASGYFQWHDKTCVGLARTNSRKIGDEMETIEDGAELAQVKKQASRVQMKSLIAGLVMTLLALLLPVF